MLDKPTVLVTKPRKISDCSKNRPRPERNISDNNVKN